MTPEDVTYLILDLGDATLFADLRKSTVDKVDEIQKELNVYGTDFEGTNPEPEKVTERIKSQL